MAQREVKDRHLRSSSTQLAATNIPHRSFMDFMNEQLLFSAFSSDMFPCARVLDLGTGDGDWAMDFSRRHPRSCVIATDIAPLPPPLSRCRFENVDFNQPWPRWAAPFDVVHGRMLGPSIFNLRSFFREAIRTLKPGGYVEMQDVRLLPEVGMVTAENQVSVQTISLLSILLQRTGGPQASDLSRLNHPRQYQHEMLACGFVQVDERREQWPIGPWSSDPALKLLGINSLEQIIRVIKEAEVPLPGSEFKPDRLQTDGLVENVRKAFKDPTVQAYFE